MSIIFKKNLNEEIDKEVNLIMKMHGKKRFE